MVLSGMLWPVHPKPLPDELLSSWLTRIASSNGLKLQTFCDRVFGKERQLWNRDIDRLAPEWLLASLAQHTGTPLNRVRETALDIYRDRLYRERPPAGQLRWILPAGVYHRKRRRFGLQFCPQCLFEDNEPYFRTCWRVAALMFCPEHKVYLHDRCPACGVPIAFHRRELGRPTVIDPGPLCRCHVCSFDFRQAASERFVPYTADIGNILNQVTAHSVGDSSSTNIGHMDVLHQICKVMVCTRSSVKLTSYVTSLIGVPDQSIPPGRYAFELRPLTERRHIIQLAAWLLAEPDDRLRAAWRAKTVRYSNLVRDFPDQPGWYLAIVSALNRRNWTNLHPDIPP